MERITIRSLFAILLMVSTFIIISTAKVFALEIEYEEEDYHIVDIALSVKDGLALSSSGQLYSWGRSDSYLHGYYYDVEALPYPDNWIGGLFDLNEGEKIVEIEATTETFMALTNQNRLFTWGNNYSGLIGNGTNTSSYTPLDITNQFGLSDSDYITQISGGNYHAAVLTQSGRLFTWGSNSNGRLGDGSSTDATSPIEILYSDLIEENDWIVGISMGGNHSGFYTAENRLFLWGSNFYGQFGDGTNTSSSVPKEIDLSGLSLGEDHIVSLEVGRNLNTAILTASGRLFTWGYNYFGLIGDGTTTNTVVPHEVTISLQSEDKVKSVDLGYRQAVVLTESHRIFTWGSNSSGEFGNGTTTESYIPIETTASLQAPLSEGEYVTQVYASDSYFGYATNLGRAFLSGSNELTDNSGNELYGKLAQFLEAELVYTTTPLELFPELTIVKTEALFTYLWGTYEDHYIEYGEDYSDINQEAIDNLYDEAYDHIYVATAVSQIENTLGTLFEDIANIPKEDRTVIFDTNGAAPMDSITAMIGSEITINDPVRVGYMFTGWLEGAPTIMPRNNLTLTATWQLIDYSITYVSDPQIEHMNESIYTVEKEIILSAPTEVAGYIFIGWFDALEGGNPVTSIPIGSTGDLSLYARFERLSYTIDFNTLGGSYVDSVSGFYQQQVPIVTQPSYNGYTFDGWYEDQAFEVLYIFSAFTEDITLYAKWTLNIYQITFDTDGGIHIEPIIQGYGTEIISPNLPTKEGYIFNGWSMEIPTTMPAEDLNITAFWLKYTTHSTVGTVFGLENAIGDLEDSTSEVVVTIDIIENASVSGSDKSVITQYVSANLEGRYRYLFIDIAVLLNKQGSATQSITQTDAPLTFTISIPVAYQGYETYHMIRLHDGIAEVLDAVYDSENQTLTFASDKFSTYAMVYETASESGSYAFWLYIFPWVIICILIAIIIWLFIIRRRDEKEVKQEVTLEEPTVIEDASDEESPDVEVLGVNVDGSVNVVRYVQSFQARMSLASDEVRNYYQIIKRELLTFKETALKYQFEQETLYYKSKPLVRLRIRGKTLVVYFKLEQSIVSKYRAEDVSDIKKYQSTPVLIRIKSDNSLKSALELVALIKETYQLESIIPKQTNLLKEHPVDTKEALVKKGLIKKVYSTKKSFIDR